jgi:hypothetical protein
MTGVDRSRMRLQIQTLDCWSMLTWPPGMRSPARSGADYHAAQPRFCDKLSLMITHFGFCFTRPEWLKRKMIKEPSLAIAHLGHLDLLTSKFEKAANFPSPRARE